ncbi:MAG: 3-hydroxyacyl-CoA dehydrogenase family protein [Bryobacterales bacterium]
MPTHDFRRAVSIGTGMMGPGIAVSLALGGLETTIVSRTAEGAERGLETARGQIATIAENGLCTADEAEAANGRLSASADLEAAVATADFVSESAPENLALKQELFATLDRAAPPEAILTTNTSGLSINAVSERCERPQRVLTAHFWNPPHLMRLVELVRGDKTSDEAVERTKTLLEACGKAVVVVKKDRPGQLGNRLQHAMVREAIHIVAEGIADAEDVDLAAKAGFGLRLPVYGIFEHQDAVGLDLVLAIQDYVNQDLAREPNAHESLKQMVERGELGRKSGKGYYDWSEKDWDELRERRDRFILEFLKAGWKQ